MQSCGSSDPAGGGSIASSALSNSIRRPFRIRPRQSDGRNQKKTAKSRKPDSGKLSLVRVEPAGKKGINLVFNQSGQEQRWLLEHTSVTEFLALLLLVGSSRAMVVSPNLEPHAAGANAIIPAARRLIPRPI